MTGDGEGTFDSAVLSRGTVLIVDENRVDLHCYRFILRMLGYQVITCGTYQEGLDLLSCGQVDLIIVSQGSSEFEGRCVLKRAMEIDKGFPVLVVAHHLDMPCYTEAMQLGAVEYLAEPITPQELEGAVQSHLWTRLTHNHSGIGRRRGNGNNLFDSPQR